MTIVCFGGIICERQGSNCLCYGHFASEMILHLHDSGIFNLKGPAWEVEKPLIHSSIQQEKKK